MHHLSLRKVNLIHFHQQSTWRCLPLGSFFSANSINGSPLLQFIKEHRHGILNRVSVGHKIVSNLLETTEFHLNSSDRHQTYYLFELMSANQLETTIAKAKEDQDRFQRNCRQNFSRNGN